MARKSWDQYFLDIAQQVAERATCNRRHVGAVIVRNHRILATGYNGSIAGLQHCDEIGHLMEANHCVRTVHGEANALCQAARYGIAVDGADIYITDSPCWRCFQLIANAGIKRIIYRTFYRDLQIFEAAQQLGIELIDLGDNQ